MSNVFDVPVAADPYEAIVSNGQAQYLLKKSSIGRLRALSKLQWLQSTSSTSSVFTTANTCVSFLLPTGLSNQIDICERMELQLSIVNNSSTLAATLLPVIFMIDRFEILAGSQLELIYSQNLLEDRLYFSKNDEEILANRINENYEYSSVTGFATTAATLAASANQLFFVELFSFLTRAQPFLKGINQQLTLNVYFAGTGVTSTSASQNISVTQARLYMYGYEFERSVQEKLLQRYATLPHYLFYNCPEWTEIAGQTLSNANSTQIVLGVFSGKQMVNTMLSIIPDAATAQNRYNYAALANLDEKDSGRSLFTDSLYIDMYEEMAKQTFPTTAPSTMNNYLLPHSIDVFRAVNNNLNLGSYNYSPNIQLQPQSVVSGSKTLLVTGYSQCVFKIQNGAISKMYA